MRRRSDDDEDTIVAHPACSETTRLLPTPEGRLLGSRSVVINDPSSSDSDDGGTGNRKKGERNVGKLNLLSAKYESLDYDHCENQPYLDEERAKGYSFIVQRDLLRWIIMCAIGILTALVACCIDITIEQLSDLKYGLLQYSMEECVTGNCMGNPYFVWIMLNVVPVLFAACLTAFFAPVSAGSGIPQVKCYLNGVKVPSVVRIKTLLIKAIGVTLSVTGGLAVGKEGPMIHSGAVIAAGISQGKSTTLGIDTKLFKSFREDHEKRDFVSGGAAAGVAAAFGAPVGGVLFSLEEGASFWNQSLTWRIFFGSMISVFTLNIVLSAYHGTPGQLTDSGLLNFGKFDDLSYDWLELPLFMVMGIIGGLLGALFNYMNYRLTVFRMRYIYRPWAQVVEAIIVAAVTASVGFIMIFFISECRPIGQDSNKYPVQLMCGDGQYNTLASIWFQTPEASVRSLFHDAAGSVLSLSVFLFFICYFFLACWTYGLSLPSGLFIPALLTGAAWGRLVGVGLGTLLPKATWIVPGKFALVGSAAMLGGIVRMTISLTVILIEATGNISFGLPLMITLMVAKWIGDYFNEGIYDIHIQLKGVPILPWKPPPLSNFIYAAEVMSHPVVTLRTQEKVRNVIKILMEETHNGFPITDPPKKENGNTSFGVFRGLILRSQLITLLKERAFNERPEFLSHAITRDTFRADYPRYPDIRDVEFLSDELEYTMDLRPFMGPAPYTVYYCASLPRIFKLFRGLGLRHLVVINDAQEVVGIVTRKDLARFRVWKHRCQMGLEELVISEKI